MKISDPDDAPDTARLDPSSRVLLAADPRLDALAGRLLDTGASVRRVCYLVENETVPAPDPPPRTAPATAHVPKPAQPPACPTGGGPAVRPDPPVVVDRGCHLVRPRTRTRHHTDEATVAAARDAFDVMWQAHAASLHVPPVPAATVLPSEWLPFFAFPMLNPAQAETVPEVRNGDTNLVVVAPTGAGKTVIGMAAALRSILNDGRRSAWLVPQRSLTDELDRELTAWRRLGLRVERLSGEHTVDVERIANADLWVATTEKFEAICRSSALRLALAEVGTLVVDEIHLLGDTARGPVLEALLSRVRGTDSDIRLIGLSATVSNAEQIADWLQARLLRIGWRPNRLTWQLPRVPANPDWNVTEAARTRLAAAITARVNAGGGGVLVFCGSRRSVRQTALVIAADRGAAVYGVHPDDLDRVYRVCLQAGVGLHYKGWEHRQEAERAFRERELDVLVATSTVAAGVNLPARAVVIRDTQVGFNDVDVATVQQMFGRAGRVGAGEKEGWAFLIVDDLERPGWQQRLVGGHTVLSQIQSSLPDHLLSEVVQGRVISVRQAGAWWTQTLAYHQGSHSLAPLHQAVRFLAEGGFLTATPTPEGDSQLAATELGKLTTRLMVSPETGDHLRRALTQVPLPDSPQRAERELIGVLCTLVPKLAQASIGEGSKLAVARLLRIGAAAPGTNGKAVLGAGDVARAALLTVANRPQAFHAGVRSIAGVPYSTIAPVLEDAPRYLHWLGSQGLLGTVHPWCAIVAADLGRRVRWRFCQPPRGSGRLLWMCEQMATPAHLEQATPALWAAASTGGYDSPDWTSTRPPRESRVNDGDYLALLGERATGSTIEEHPGYVTATGPAGAALATWTDRAYQLTPVRRGSAVGRYPDGCGSTGAALFTWRGDHRATGWLAAYARAERQPASVDVGG